MSATGPEPVFKNPWLASRLRSSNFFRIKVGSGDKQETFYVHEDILKSTSPYFATLIGSDFIEASTKEVTLDDSADSVEAFRYIVEFMYSPTRTYSVEVRGKVTNKYSTMGVLHARIFIMAHRLCLEDLEEIAFVKLRNALLDGECIGGCVHNWGSGDLCTAIDLVYSHTTSEQEKGDKGPRTVAGRLRALLAAYTACWLPEYEMKARLQALYQQHPDFVVELLTNMNSDVDMKELGWI